MSNLEYINYRKLEVGDQVSWEHPVTGKVYDFEVTYLDLKDEYQPVELQLLDDLEHGDVIIVSEYAEFPFKGVRRWLYISNRSYDDRYGYGIPENSITLDRLFYTSMHHVPKSAETEEIENGRILAHRALMEDLTTAEGDGSSEIALVAPEVRGELNIPSADDEVFKMVGDHDWIYYDIESYYHATVMHANERILTCEDLEPTTMVKLLKPENVASFKNEGLIEKVDEDPELAENLIFPVEEARANKEKFFTLKRELVQISQLIKEASAQGKSCVGIPSDLDRLEITTQFSRAGYKIYAGCIAW